MSLLQVADPSWFNMDTGLNTSSFTPANQRQLRHLGSASGERGAQTMLDVGHFSGTPTGPVQWQMAKAAMDLRPDRPSGYTGSGKATTVAISAYASATAPLRALLDRYGQPVEQPRAPDIPIIRSPYEIYKVSR